MTSHTQLIVDRVMDCWTRERMALSLEIESDMNRLEALRQKEAILRAVLVNELKVFGYQVKRAEHKIETRQYADGNPGLDTDWEHLKTAGEALTDCVDDIAHVVSEIEGKQHDLDDLQLWKEEKQA